MHPDGTYDIAYDDGVKESRVPAPMVLVDYIPPPPFENIILAYDTKLVKVGQRIANYMNGQWQVGTISSTTYSKKNWVEYPNLPKVKGVKKSDRGKLIYQEFTHALDPGGHMKTWVFLQ